MRKRSPKTFLVASVFVALVTIQAEAQNSADTEIEAKLAQIVTLRKRQYEEAQVLVSEGQSITNNVAAINLCRARIDLARERKQRSEIIVQMETIIAIYRRQFETAILEAELGKGSPADAQVQLLTAEIELKRERTKQRMPKK